VRLSGAAPLRVVAAFDIGSNSIKMTVARQTPDGGVVEIASLAETTRLGAGIEETGRLSEESIAASLDALRSFVTTARSFGATTFLGVATEATRIAANGPAFLQTLRDELGLQVETISGDREAAMTFAGIPPGLRDRGVVLAADVGGASTELIAARDGTIEQAVSYQIGSGRYTDRFVAHDPPRAAELTTMRTAATQITRDNRWPEQCDKLIVLGGTGEFLKRLLGHEWPATPGELETQLDRLTTVRSTDLAPMIGASEMRARVLPAGVAIVAALSDASSPTEIHGAASGIRMGLILEAFREDAS
jgi:exopolyphosphatase/guanosine-5'-triphosphate,3'-diphosphate pyrophosphatase